MLKKKKKRIGESKAQALLNLINIAKIPPKVHIYLPFPLAWEYVSINTELLPIW